MWLRARTNPIRLGRVLVLYLFLIPFSSLSPSLFSLSFAFSSSFFVLALTVLMTVLLSRESLPRERFAIEGCSYRFPGAYRPFNLASHSRRHRRELNVSFLTKTRKRHLTFESVGKKLTRLRDLTAWCIEIHFWCIIWRIMSSYRQYFFKYQ